jgi:hypothetical protein
MFFKDLPSLCPLIRLFFAMGLRCTVSILLLMVCYGCATVPPLEEVRLFSKAFYTLDGASQPLLDDLGVAERRQGIDNAITKAKGNSYTGDCKGIGWAEPGFIEGFCLDDAPYFSEIGDPPATRAFRQGVRVIGEYSEILSFLAEGRNMEETSAQVQALGQNIAALASLASGIGWIGAALGPALGALQPVIEEAVQAENVKELKRLVLDGAPRIKELIKSLRDAAPEFFNTLVYQSVKAATSPEALENEAVAEQHIARISAYRMAK